MEAEEKKIQYSFPGPDAGPQPPILFPDQVEFLKQFPHVCKDCKWLKPVVPGTKLPPQDLIGYCKIIHWPFYWCVSKYVIVKKCKWFEPRSDEQVLKV